jgi:hypothetical protein
MTRDARERKVLLEMSFGPRETRMDIPGKIAGGEDSPDGYDRSNSVVSKKGESARPSKVHSQ